ncbi:hypothetical protein RF55_16299 [Lasius niger]|uniref:DUF5641 domain-containing protein n=1 Tax=Lasius niger TaxID=67767 RepID=A0A0J7MXV7_LASNI|nr:hypothetical protein RF55_16299 [Lasius niger]
MAFQPACSPALCGSLGGSREVKHHLKRVIGESILTFEEISTILAQIEACLNSRPLTALTDDPDDMSALTPGHFLVGTALNTVPEPSLAEEPVGRLSRWQYLQQMCDHFWQRWSREYLHTLSTLPKWWRTNATLRIGDLCIIRNELTPPGKWPLARITALHPGDDGEVRVVTMRTASTILKKPVAKIVLLPTAASDAQDAKG